MPESISPQWTASRRADGTVLMLDGQGRERGLDGSTDQPRPPLSERNRVAAQVWRTLHPNSQFGQADITKGTTE